MATITILGSGTSDGIPQIGCTCAVCTSDDPHDKRLRSSALIRHEGKNVLIDCGPDFREQALRYGIDQIDAILCTHHHFDHITGLGELRPLSRRQEISVYALPATIEHIKTRFAYAFNPEQHGGGNPALRLIPLRARQEIEGLTVLTFTVMHGNVPITGFRIGGMVYITDASAIPGESKEIARKCPLLIVNALREKPHPTHFSIAEACAFAAEIEAERCFFIHMAHLVRHADVSETLPDRVWLAYDGLTLEFDLRDGFTE
ncbi:MAG: MBL fold metallo-hydrolase [Spirochaetota bacterium]|jgi:phosphoribosyl 1,2-cyclic phosphate phosphodiesterase|nr:MBL fold metallo-hydrolase [Spirochaetota bacterium]